MRRGRVLHCFWGDVVSLELDPAFENPHYECANEIHRLEAELAEVKAGYHLLDRNWHAIHEAAMNAIRNAIGLPDATVPEMCTEIARLRLNQQQS